MDDHEPPYSLDFDDRGEFIHATVSGKRVTRETTNRIYVMKRDLLSLKRAVSPVVDHGWMKSIYFKDPNGLMLEFACTTRQLGDPDDAKMQVRFRARFADLELSRHLKNR